MWRELTRDERRQIVREMLRWRLAPIVCFFKDHNIKPSPRVWAGEGQYKVEPDYCDRCGREESDRLLLHTIPGYLWHANYWLVEHCGLYSRFHLWMLNNHPRRMPDWMEY